MNGAELAVRALEAEGIRFAFGIPGTHNLELYDALERSSQARTVLVTDEQSASFMADGVWRASGELACVNLVPGAGLTQALSGIAEAYMDGVPLLVLACGVRRDLDKAFQLHDIDQLLITRAVSKAQLRCPYPNDIYAVIREACQLAKSAPGGPVIVEIPSDFFMVRHIVEPPAQPPAQTRPATATDADLAEVVARLSQSRRTLLYYGFGAAEAGSDLIELAERLEAPVATTICGKSVFPESHPLWLWNGYGLPAPHFVRDIAEGCDLTLAIGCRFAEVGTGGYATPPPGRLVHLDIEPGSLNRNYSADVALVADAAAFIESLLERLPPRPPDPELRRAISDGHNRVREPWIRPRQEGRVSPPYLLSRLQEVVEKDAVYVADSGSSMFYAVECLRLDRSRSFLAPVDYSCMGYAIPAAIGAAMACPDRPVVALEGDGAFLMTGLELLTAVHWAVPVMVIVLRDRELGQIAQFQQVAFAEKQASELTDFDLAGLCRAIHIAHFGITDDIDVVQVLERAEEERRRGRPVVVEVAVDYSGKTYFSRGVVRAFMQRMPWSERLAFAARAIRRRLPIS